MSLLDDTIEDQVELEQVKESIAEEAALALALLLPTVTTALAPLDVQTVRRRRLVGTLLSLEGDVSTKLNNIADSVSTELANVARFAAASEAEAIEAEIGKDIKDPTAAQIAKQINETPMGHSGENYSEFLQKFVESEKNRLMDTITLGIEQGLSTTEVIALVTATMATVRRNMESIIATAAQHVASTSRELVWETNPQLVKRYRWVSILDSRTTQTCRSLSGRVFQVGKGPTPPMHYRCRSTTVALVGSEKGTIPEGQTYYGWLKTRPPAFQDRVLGVTRGRLFRDGGLTAEEFSRLNLDRRFRPRTLKEMEKYRPAVFKRAGLS